MPHSQRSNNHQLYLNSFRELSLPVAYYIRDATGNLSVYLYRILGINFFFTREVVWPCTTYLFSVVVFRCPVTNRLCSKLRKQTNIMSKFSFQWGYFHFIDMKIHALIYSLLGLTLKIINWKQWLSFIELKTNFRGNMEDEARVLFILYARLIRCRFGPTFRSVF